MQWNDRIKAFITQHIDDDTSRLLLAARRYPDVDVPFAVGQIEARRRIRTKLPEWYAQPDLILSGRIPAEQCSSEQTARYKRSILPDRCRSLCDMTGGMGVDFWYMSAGVDRAIYTEQQAPLCEAAAHNFEVLRRAETMPSHTVPEIRHGCATSLPVPDVEVIYLDPARRSSAGGRIYEIADCEPDVIAWQDELMAHASIVLTKVSPMADIARTLSRLRCVSEVHIVGVKGECKELLFKQVRAEEGVAREIVFHCVDFLTSGRIDYRFTASELAGSTPVVEGEVGRYLYEPDVTIMKAQAFASLCRRFDLRSLDRDTHLMTSDVLRPDFPGRIFEIENRQPFASSKIRQLGKEIPQANIAVRNFPLSADELRRRAGIRDGGDVYLFGATVSGMGAQLFRCRKVERSSLL